ncbi:cation transporter [Hoeflea sp. WL0058]|uniref:Cation transporter n=1 Tax=Flavimaribacter sediminis TaxID=2865987 RepID=A0AAE2ZUA9_9HYPH|nr:cation transporter [Flavimaribacter sediminis]MBW8640513.1 cation transporter [Flavimaribacter sediminis]
MRLLSERTRDPTRKEISHERAVIYSSLADSSASLLQLVFAVTTGSLTLLSEFARSSFMLMIEVYSLWLLAGIHRGRMTHFQYGVGKIEQFSWLIIGLGMTASGVWVAEKVVRSLVEESVPPTPMGLAFAAIVNAFNLTINWVSLFALVSGDRTEESEIYKAQIKSRVVKCANSTFLQITLTVATLAKDPVVGLFMDGLGAAFVAVIMVVNGLMMIARSLPDLLDAPLSGIELSQISETVRALDAPHVQILNIRSRRSGQFPHVEILVSPVGGDSAGKLLEEIGRLRDALRALDSHIDATFVVALQDKAAT